MPATVIDGSNINKVIDDPINNKWILNLIFIMLGLAIRNLVDYMDA